MAKPTLLAVDDDASVLSAIAFYLRRQYGEKYKIVRADSGESALEALEEIHQRGETVALILSDQRMPGMGGVELKYKLRGIEISRDFASDLPPIPAHGSELNQVWTNLLDNAADVLKDGDQVKPDAKIGLKTWCDGRTPSSKFSTTDRAFPMK